MRAISGLSLNLLQKVKAFFYLNLQFIHIWILDNFLYLKLVLKFNE